MKSLILLSILALFFFSFSNAQGFGVGVKVGTNINKLQGQSFKEEFTYGYSAGAYADIKLGNKWSIQPEVLFNQVSADTSDKFSDLVDFNSGKVSKIKLNYISIPLLLNYNISKGISLQAGPQYGILMSQDRDLLQDGKEAFKKGDFSMLAGLQLKFASIRLYGRYAVGLNNISDVTNNDKWKNQSIQLGIGLTLL
ncbi:MAG TPA: porin family protein [Ferruginibacter sp.]|nr:porin family protein [Ferruginibacter sp.]HPH91540.1 porin family protein [Ferruginibacter sp.]